MKQPQLWGLRHVHTTRACSTSAYAHAVDLVCSSGNAHLIQSEYVWDLAVG